MKKTYFLIAAILSVTTFAKSLTINISPWVSSCENEPERRCQIPTSLGQPLSVQLPIKEVNSPGEAQVSTLDISSEEFIDGNLKAFSVFPHENSPYPPYVQFQLNLKKPIELICSHSVSIENLNSIPPLICAAKYNEDRFGITVTFSQLMD